MREIDREREREIPVLSAAFITAVLTRGMSTTMLEGMVVL